MCKPFFGARAGLSYNGCDNHHYFPENLPSGHLLEHSQKSLPRYLGEVVCGMEIPFNNPNIKLKADGSVGLLSAAKETKSVLKGKNKFTPCADANLTIEYRKKVKGYEKYNIFGAKMGASFEKVTNAHLREDIDVVYSHDLNLPEFPTYVFNSNPVIGTDGETLYCQREGCGCMGSPTPPQYKEVERIYTTRSSVDVTVFAGREKKLNHDGDSPKIAGHIGAKLEYNKLITEAERKTIESSYLSCVLGGKVEYKAWCSPKYNSNSYTSIYFQGGYDVTAGNERSPFQLEAGVKMRF